MNLNRRDVLKTSLSLPFLPILNNINVDVDQPQSKQKLRRVEIYRANIGICFALNIAYDGMSGSYWTGASKFNKICNLYLFEEDIYNFNLVEYNVSKDVWIKTGTTSSSLIDIPFHSLCKFELKDKSKFDLLKFENWLNDWLEYCIEQCINGPYTMKANYFTSETTSKLYNYDYGQGEGKSLMFNCKHEFCGNLEMIDYKRPTKEEREYEDMIELAIQEKRAINALRH